MQEGVTDAALEGCAQQKTNHSTCSLLSQLQQASKIVHDAT